MGTRRLSFSENLVAEALPPVDGVFDVEVAAGESHYQIHQPGAKSSTYRFHLRHPESQVLITGLVETAGESAPILCTEVIHHAPRTFAETHIRTVVRGSAQPHYNGLIRMEKGAKSAESYLNHHSLLLSDQAKSWTRPSLEIETNDVKCSHAATVRTVTDLDLFYLLARGIPRNEAQELIVTAFIAEVT